MEYKKVNQSINNIVNEQIRKLESLFPSAVKDGEVDFEALKEELGQFSEVTNEKYELTWAGKKNAKKIAQEDIIGKTLKYIEEDSKNPGTTENLYIEGDNLEVLKLLRQNYYGAIKMIYIDPPYNTGNRDFRYDDAFVETLSHKITEHYIHTVFTFDYESSSDAGDGRDDYYTEEADEQLDLAACIIKDGRLFGVMCESFDEKRFLLLDHPETVIHHPGNYGGRNYHFYRSKQFKLIRKM